MSEQQGAGKAKVFLSYIEIILTIAAIGFKLFTFFDLGKLPGGVIVLLGSAIFGLFIAYCLVDIFWWRGHLFVWIFGLAAIGVAGYWWLSFLNTRGIPAQPLLPLEYYPQSWMFFILGGILILYCIWDMLDAWINEYRDERLLFRASFTMIAAIVVWMLISASPPQA